MPNFDHLIDDLAADLKPVRPVSPLAGQLLLAAVAAATLFAAAVSWGLSGAVESLRPSPASVVSGGLFFLLGLAGGWAATRMTRPAIGRPSNGWRWAGAAVAVLPVAAILLAVMSASSRTGLSWDDGIGCMLRGLVASAGAAAALTMWLRRGAPLRVHSAAWVIGLTAGAVGALAVALTCPDDAFTHIGLWHVAIVAGAGITGRMVLPPFLRW